MNLEALTVIGTLTLVLAVLFFFPVYIWIKRKRKKEAAAGVVHDRLTKIGVTLIALLITGLLVGSAQGILLPQTPFGRFVSTSIGRSIYYIGVLVAWIGIAFVADKCGYQIFKRGDTDA